MGIAFIVNIQLFCCRVLLPNWLYRSYMSEIQIKATLQKARQVHRALKIPSHDVESQLDYVRDKVSSRPIVPCGCVNNYSHINAGFRRAFSTFSPKEKVEFYLKMATLLQEILSGEDSVAAEKEPIKTTFYFFNENEKEWETRQIEISETTKVIKTKSNGEEIDLHNYLLRKSKKKDRESLALESTQPLQLPQVMRLSNHKQTYEEFKTFMERLTQAALKDNFFRALKTHVPKKQVSLKKTNSIMLEDKTIDKYATATKDQLNKADKDRKNVAVQEETRIHKSSKVEKSKQKDKKIQEAIDVAKVQHDARQALLRKFMNSMSHSAGMHELRENVLVDLKEGRMRKIYELGIEDQPIPFQWLRDNFFTPGCFRRWKKSLLKASIIPHSHPRIFTEQHRYRNGNTLSYCYTRQYVENSTELFFIDTYSQSPNCLGHIEHCIWKFWRSGQRLWAAAEGSIHHGPTKPGYPSLQLTDQFLGEVGVLCRDLNFSLLNETDMQINTILFGEEYLQQIDGMSEDELEEYKSITELSIKSEVPSGILSSISDIVGRIKSALTLEQALQLPSSANRLQFHHPQAPYKKGQAHLNIPQKKGGHPYWDGQWEFTQEGQMININEEKIKAQSGVLKSLAKTLASNLFKGKSILNISLPVTVFSNESNLSLLCKSYAYAPLLLERAAACKNPVKRLAQIVAFAVSCNVAYIKMDKPFNPILGETFQTIIDGCPVNGEQISHHPPISSTYMQGRNYCVYGCFQAKVNLGVNTATGSNEGYVHVAFGGRGKDVVKFNFPPGQISGLAYGKRKLAAVQKSYFFDYDNMLYIQMNFGKHKGQTEYCKYIDGMQGKIVRLKKGIDTSKLQKISKKSIQAELGVISGRWTKEVYFEEELLFDSWKDFPFICEDYPCPLESNAYYRKDLQLKRSNQLEASQTAKEELEEIQRNDRKLRKKYTGKEH